MKIKSAQNLRVPRTILLFISVCFVGFPAKAQYGGGTGEPNDPYLIYTAEHLNTIGTEPKDWDKHFKLMSDIDLSAYTESSFNTIGTTYEISGTDYWNPFRGVFDGNGKRIYHFTYSHRSNNRSCGGLFGFVDNSNTEIKDLGLIEPLVDLEGNSIAALIGYLRHGSVTGCYISGGSISGWFFTGSLVGTNAHGTITDCYSTAQVKGWQNVGGLVGGNYFGGKIINCYATGNVSGGLIGGLVGRNVHSTIVSSFSDSKVWGDDGVGGLVGGNYYDGIISNCYATGEVTGIESVGGLAGGNWYGRISRCFSAGKVRDRDFGSSDIGGLVGRMPKFRLAAITDSFWDIQSSGQSTSAGGIGKTMAQMRKANTFINWGSESLWKIKEGSDYPRLCWEGRSGQPLNAQLSDFLVGTGEPNDAYLIYTPEQLSMIGLFCCEWDKHFKLMEDIDLTDYTGTAFNIIGTDWDNRFNGIFEGNGHLIINFSYRSIDTDYVGLFGNVSGTIRNLGLVNPKVDAGTGDKVGSLVGHLNGGAISNCYAEGSNVTGEWWVGRLVGLNEGTVNNCYATGTITGDVSNLTDQ